MLDYIHTHPDASAGESQIGGQDSTPTDPERKPSDGGTTDVPAVTDPTEPVVTDPSITIDAPEDSENSPQGSVMDDSSKTAPADSPAEPIVTDEPSNTASSSPDAPQSEPSSEEMITPDTDSSV
jgi:hypothetical protein